MTPHIVPDEALAVYRLLIGLVLLLAGCAGPTWEEVGIQIRKKYPEVRQIETETLAESLATRHPPLLLDVRSEEEYEVSHLRGAYRVEPDEDRTPAIPLDTPIVTYCSVGYRSCAYAQKLLEAGFTNVANLKGSIFQWANEGRPVYRNGERVHVVHPYNARWGRLLNKNLHSR